MREQSTFKWYFAIAALVLMICTTIALKTFAKTFKHGTVTLGGGDTAEIHLNVDIASTGAAREQGLSGRDGLGKDEGMLFLFDESGTQVFWMKDMRFPIDIIWADKGKVVDLAPNVPPPVVGQPLLRYAPLLPADVVLEVPQGFIKKHGITPGMSLNYTIDK